FAQRVKHAAVWRRQPGGRELEAAEPVALVRIGARQIEDEAGWRVAMALPQRGERAVERLQVLLVAAAVGQLDVEVARLLAEREVLRAVQRQREHGRVVAEDGR